MSGVRSASILVTRYSLHITPSGAGFAEGAAGLAEEDVAAPVLARLECLLEMERLDRHHNFGSAFRGIRADGAVAYDSVPMIDTSV